jgi:hypothetical protein
MLKQAAQRRRVAETGIARNDDAMRTLKATTWGSERFSSTSTISS